MFPIPFNFPFIKSNGQRTTIGAAISEGGGGSYTLPTASASTKGGVKIGSGLLMDGEVLNATGGSYTLPTASADTKGGVKIGSGLSMDGEVLNNSNPTPYSLPTASSEVLGGVKVGSGLSINDGVLSANGGSNGIILTPIDITSHSGAEFTVNDVDLTNHKGLAICMDTQYSNYEFTRMNFIIKTAYNDVASISSAIFGLKVASANDFPTFNYRMITYNDTTKKLTVGITQKLTFTDNAAPTHSTQNNIGRVDGIYYIDF